LDNTARIDHLKARLQDSTDCALRDIRVVCSPLRISPLGAHVDHQGGLVTGMTLDRSIVLAFVPRGDRRVRVQSLNYPGTVAFDMDNVPARIAGDWGNYIRGAVLALQQKYELGVGIDALVEGDMPVGGLSSSAAVGIAYLLALEAVNELEVTPEANIEHDRFIENVYLGLKNGILDQSIILMSDRDHLTFLDCEEFEFAKYPTPVQNGCFEVLVAHSGLATSLASTDYNRRVTECQQATRRMLEWAGEPVPENLRLRMVSDEIYDAFGERLPDVLRRRARHFFTENWRVREGVRAWQAGDLHKLGDLINASGASSVYNYESGCPHLITLYNVLRECPGVYGARFSGGGFRGSCIGLVDPTYRKEIVAHIDAHYPRAHPDVSDLYSVHFCRLDGPARLLNGYG
jgi:galactokinase/galacturonokinase